MKVLYTKDEIQARVKELGKAISEDYRNQEFVILSILTGAFIFTADLVRCIDGKYTIEFIKCQSYGDAQVSSGQCVVDMDANRYVDKSVLIIDDIADTNLTLKTVSGLLGGAKDVNRCVMFHKPSRAKHDISLDYVGFEIEDKFIFGYGLDLEGCYRGFNNVYIFED